jgi:hypothetical protein
MFSLDMSGLDAFRARLAYARAQLPDLMDKAVHDAGQFVAQNLQDAAPVGTSEGPPPSGDAPGHLASSFYTQSESSQFASGAAVTVRTNQPQKLEWVRYGTGIYAGKGRIYPTNKRALFWPGADHPYRSVAGQRANDFVTPALEEAPNADEVLGVVVDELIGILEG